MPASDNFTALYGDFTQFLLDVEEFRKASNLEYLVDITGRVEDIEIFPEGLAVFQEDSQACAGYVLKF